MLVPGRPDEHTRPYARGCSLFPALVPCSAPQLLGFRAARTTRPTHAARPHVGPYAPFCVPAKLELLWLDVGKGREERGGRGEERRGQGTPCEVGAEALRQAAVRQPSAPLQHVQHLIYF